MVSNDYRELILFLMIYQTPNNFQHSIFNPTLLENPNHRLIWFPGWLNIDLFVRRKEERLRWRENPLADLLMFHDSLLTPGSPRRRLEVLSLTEALWLVNGATWGVARVGWVWQGSAVGGPGPASHYRVWPGTDMELWPDMELTATERVVTAGTGGPSRPRVHWGQYRSRGIVYICADKDYESGNDIPSVYSFVNSSFSWSLMERPWPRYCPVWRQLSGHWPPPAWLGSLLLPRPTQTYNWNKSRTPPQINQFPSLWSSKYESFCFHMKSELIVIRIYQKRHFNEKLKSE